MFKTHVNSSVNHMSTDEMCTRCGRRLLFWLSKVSFVFAQLSAGIKMWHFFFFFLFNLWYFFVELLHDDADPAGCGPETLLVRQHTRSHHNGEEDAVLGLQRRTFSDGVREPGGSGEDEAGLVEGAEAVLPHQPLCLRSCLQSQQAFQHRVLKLNWTARRFSLRVIQFWLLQSYISCLQNFLLRSC